MQSKRSYRVIVEEMITKEIIVDEARTPDEAEQIAEALAESGEGLIVEMEIVDSKAEAIGEDEGE
jgi:hypothetical protein